MVQALRGARPLHDGRREGAGPSQSGEACQDFIEFKTLCAEAALNKYDSDLVAKSIRLLINHKGKPWFLSEPEAESNADIVISWPTQEAQ